MEITTATEATIVALRPERAASVGDVLAASHGNYPSFSYLFPDPTRREGILRSTFTAVARDALFLGGVYGAVAGDRLLGVAVWLPPGRFPWSPGRKLRGTPPFLSVLWRAPRSFTAFMRLGRNAERAFPPNPHWYLEVLGVRPEAQGVGLGTRLLEPVLAHADRDGIPCYLETADRTNVAFYERLGFALEGELQLVPGGPPHWAMRRPAAGAGGALTSRKAGSVEPEPRRMTFGRGRER